jgi:peptidoglycan biosynthesis protein MviN/MurJ (putative lipid II flippase)
MSSSSIGLLLIVVGLALAALGLVLWLGAFDWFGKLPGDIRIERDSLKIYVPLVSMLLLSALATAILHLVRRFFS